MNTRAKIYQNMIETDKENVTAHYGLLSIAIEDKNLDEVETEHYQVLKHRKKKDPLKKDLFTELAEFYVDHDPGKHRIAKKDDLYIKAEKALSVMERLAESTSEAEIVTSEM